MLPFFKFVSDSHFLMITTMLAKLHSSSGELASNYTTHLFNVKVFVSNSLNENCCVAFLVWKQKQKPTFDNVFVFEMWLVVMNL